MNKLFKSKSSVTIAALLAIMILLAPFQQAQAANSFPRYSFIEPNIVFWEKVYGRYTSRQGILHDKDNLDIIYTVIDLVDWQTPGASRINKKLIKLARHRYKAILADLGSGKKPTTAEEKKTAALFPKQRHSTYLKARDRIRLQIGQKDRFYKGVILSGTYMPAFKKIFRSYGLPEDLAYLPHVESSFNLQAHSKAGATGLWQFIRSTGKRFMTIDSVVDERLDPILATHAAAKLLKENYSKLNSWPLALTAYNYGQAGMIRAQREKKTYENIFRNHQTGLFKFASRNFYLEFLAARRVAKDIENNPSIILDRPEATITFPLKGYAAARDLRSYFGVSKEDIARLNPALKKPVLNGKKYVPKGYLLRLPATKQVRLKAANTEPNFYRSRQIRDQVYTVRRGDTAAAIAHRYQIPLKELITANNLNRKATIHAGRKLRIPGKAADRGSGSIMILKSNAKKKP